MFSFDSTKTQESQTPQWVFTVACIVAIVSIPTLLIAVLLNIADLATLQASGFMETLRRPTSTTTHVSTRSLIGAVLSGPDTEVLGIYESMYPSQTTRYVAFLLLPGLIDELQGDVRASRMEYIIDVRLPVLVHDYVHDAPLCSKTQEQQIITAIQRSIAPASNICRPVLSENEQEVMRWLTTALQNGFNSPEHSIQGIIYPQRIETSERTVYTRFSQYAHYSAILTVLLCALIVVTTGLNLHTSMRWLGAVFIAAGILGVGLRALTGSGLAFDGVVILQQYSRQAAWSGLPLGVLLRTLADPAFYDWSNVSACIVLFAGTVGVGLGSLQTKRHLVRIGELAPMEGIHNLQNVPNPSLTAVVRTVSVTDALPAGLVTNPLEVIPDVPPAHNNR